MTENVEEIAVLIENLRQENESNSEGYIRLLSEIKNRLEDVQNDNVALTEIRNIIDTKLQSDQNRFSELGDRLENLRSALNNSTDYTELTEQVKTLADNFKSGFNSVVNFANKDADAKNLLLDRMDALEKAVKNGAMVDTLRQRTDELVHGYENFISDSNLRHGNMVSALVDLKNKIDDYSSKNNYVYGSIEHSLDDTNSKIVNLESTVSSNLGNVNSKLYAMGDDIQKILNDGFDHLKYLSSNMSEAMNSSSLDLRTTVEALKANILDYSDHLKEEFTGLNNDISSKIEAGNDTGTMLSNDIIDNLKRLESTVTAKADEHSSIAGSNLQNIVENIKNIEASVLERVQANESNVSGKMNEVVDFINALKEAIQVLKVENEAYLGDRLAEMKTQIQSINDEFEKLVVNSANELQSVTHTVAQTSDDIVKRLQETDIEEIVAVKEALLKSSSENFNSLIEKIQGVNTSVDDFKNSTAEKLSDYLTSIQGLFGDFSDKINYNQSGSEVMEKLSNLEVIMSRMDIEKNENFATLQKLIENNAAAIETIKDSTPDTDKFEVLLNNQNNSNAEKFNELKNLINEASENRNDNFSSLIELINNNSSNKDERLGNIINLINDLSQSKNANFEELKKLIEDYGWTKDEKFNVLTKLMNEYKTSKEEKIEALSSMVNEYENTKEEQLESLKNIVYEYKNSLDKLNESIQSQSKSTLSELSEIKLMAGTNGNNPGIEKLSELFDGKIFGYKEDVSKEFQAVKDLINELSVSLGNISPEFNDSVLTTKLSLIDDQLSEYSQSYEQSIAFLNARLTEYIDSVERVSNETNTKLENSAQAFEAITTRFDELSEKLTSLVGNSGLIEILANIRQQFNVVTEEIKTEKEGVVSEVRETLDEVLAIINNNLYLVGQNIESLYSQQLDTSSNLVSSIDAGVAAVKTDINAIIPEIEHILQDKINAIKNEFTPYEEAIKKFAEFDIAKALNSMKDEIELSYVNYSAEIKDNNAAAENAGVELAYKKTVEKLSDLESLIKDDVSSQIESINHTIANITSNSSYEINSELQPRFDEIENKLNELLNEKTSSLSSQLTELKALLYGTGNQTPEEMRSSLMPVFDDNEIIDVIRGLNKNLADKLTEMKQDQEMEAQDVADIVNSVKNTVEYTLDVINDKFENSNKNAQKILEGIENLESKIDLVSMAAKGLDLSDTVSELKGTVELLKNIEGLNQNPEFIKNALSDIDEKIDDIAKSNNTEELDVNFKEIRDSLGNIQDKLENTSEVEKLFSVIDSKLDVLAKYDDSEILENFDDVVTNINTVKSEFDESVKRLEAKLDILAADDNEELLAELEDLRYDLEEISDKVESVAKYGDNNITSDLSDVKYNINEIFNILDNQANSSGFTELKEQIAITEANLENYSRTLDEKLDELSQGYESDSKFRMNIESMVKELNNKVDIIAMSDDSGMLDEIYEIKDIVESQIEALKEKAADTSELQKLSEELITIDEKLNNLDLSKSAEEIKESVITAVVSLTNSISFAEESEEIKDFVDVKTNELHRILMDVKRQLSDMGHNEDDMELYTYTLQDVESDLAKLRLVVNDMSNKVADNELSVVSANLNKVTKSMDDLKNVIIDSKSKQSEYEDLSNEVTSISSRLNQLILSQQKADGEISEKLDDNMAAISGIDTKIFERKIEKSLSELNKKVEYSANIITVLRNVMGYLGQWMDGTTDTLSAIYDRCKLPEIVDELKSAIPAKSELFDFIDSKYYQQEANIENLQNIVDNVVSQAEFRAEELQNVIDGRFQAQNSKIENLFTALEEKTNADNSLTDLANMIKEQVAIRDAKIEELENIVNNKINKQESRLDRIEKQLDKIYSVLENTSSINDTKDKVYELDEKLSKLSENIEKLAAYVE